MLSERVAQYTTILSLMFRVRNVPHEQLNTSTTLFGDGTPPTPVPRRKYRGDTQEKLFGLPEERVIDKSEAAAFRNHRRGGDSQDTLFGCWNDPIGVEQPRLIPTQATGSQQILFSTYQGRQALVGIRG